MIGQSTASHRLSCREYLFCRLSPDYAGLLEGVHAGAADRGTPYTLRRALRDSPG